MALDLEDKEACPNCGDRDTECLGSIEADVAILGTDERLWRCSPCGCEWVREKGGERMKVLQGGDS